MSQSIELQGVKELEAELKALNVRMSEVTPILKEALEPVRASASASIPTGPGRTGAHLNDNVVVETSGKTVGVTFRGGLQNGPLYYGKFGEFGTKHEGAKSYIRDAAATNEGRIRSTVESGIKSKLGG